MLTATPFRSSATHLATTTGTLTLTPRMVTFRTDTTSDVHEQLDGFVARVAASQDS